MSERGHVDIDTQDRSILKRFRGGYRQSSVKMRYTGYTTDM